MKNDFITKSKLGNIQIINIMMYVTILFVNLYLFRDIILFSQKIVSSQEK